MENTINGYQLLEDFNLSITKENEKEVVAIDPHGRTRYFCKCGCGDKNGHYCSNTNSYNGY